MSSLLYGAAVALYLFSALVGLGTERERREGSVQARLDLWVLPLALIAHGWLLHDIIFTPEGVRFGFSYALSTALWLAAGIYWLESWSRPLLPLRVLVLPSTAVGVLLPIVFPGVPKVINQGVAFKLHLSVAMLAYSMLTIAMLHAIVMMMVERRLHTPPAQQIRKEGNGRLSKRTYGEEGVLGTLIDQLPPLLALERTLFRMIGAGFALLTATVVSGIGFSEQVFGQSMRFDHKTVFALLSWLTFGVLLFGRVRHGWRGRMALRFTVGGFAMLLLAYIGSRFVMEMLLHRG